MWTICGCISDTSAALHITFNWYLNHESWLLMALQAYQACEQARNFRHALAAALGLPEGATAGACIAAARRLLTCSTGGPGLDPSPSPGRDPHVQARASPRAKAGGRQAHSYRLDLSPGRESAVADTPPDGRAAGGDGSSHDVGLSDGSADEDDKENLASCCAGMPGAKAGSWRRVRRVRCGGWPEVQVFVPGDRAHAAAMQAAAQPPDVLA